VCSKGRNSLPGLQRCTSFIFCPAMCPHIRNFLGPKVWIDRQRRCRRRVQQMANHAPDPSRPHRARKDQEGVSRCHLHEMGFSAVDGNRPVCCVVDCLLFKRLFRTHFPSGYLGSSAWFGLRHGSLSSMWAGLVVQDSYVRYSPVVDPFWWRGRDGFICMSTMSFGYWYWIAGVTMSGNAGWRLQFRYRGLRHQRRVPIFGR